MNGLLQIICRTGIFMICAQAVVHFRPQASYEKYLKLLVSAMVLIQLFLPVSRFLFRGDSEELEKQTQAFLEGLEEELAAAESRAYETDALLEQMTLEEIRRRVEEADPGDSGRENAGAEIRGAETGGTEISGSGNGETENGRPDIGESRSDSGTTDGETNNNAIQIDRIRVEEIWVQPDTVSPE